jgi:uncharacterized glyoxalase superfamily protein PhnB
VEEPNDKPYGDRMCTLDDPEGHRWFISTHTADVPPEQWGG